MKYIRVFFPEILTNESHTKCFSKNHFAEVAWAFGSPWSEEAEWFFFMVKSNSAATIHRSVFERLTRYAVIASAKSGKQHFVSLSKKKRTRSWFHSLRQLSVPLEGSKYGFTKIITDSDTDVNPQFSLSLVPFPCIKKKKS